VLVIQFWGPQPPKYGKWQCQQDQLYSIALYEFMGSYFYMDKTHPRTNRRKYENIHKAARICESNPSAAGWDPPILRMSKISQYKRKEHAIGETQPSSAYSTAQISSIIARDRKKIAVALACNVQAHFQRRSFHS